MKLRVGLVGLGTAWERRHRSALLSMSDRFDVRAICEQVSHRAEQAARVFDAVTVDGYHALVRREDIDAILMLSPQWFGCLPIQAACEAGKAVYCAAAMDLDPEEAVRVKACVEQAGIAFMVEFPRRLAPATLRLKELIATQLGRPRLLFCHRRRTIDQQGSEDATNSVIRRELIELVDWCNYVVGMPPKSVIGNGRSGVSSDGGYRMISVDFGDGSGGQSGEDSPLAQISCGNYVPESWAEASAFRPPTELQVCCENGIAFIDLPSSLVWFNEAGRHVESLEAELPVGEQLFGQFYRAVTSLVRSTADLDQADIAFRAVIGAERSRAEGKCIDLR